MWDQIDCPLAWQLLHYVHYILFTFWVWCPPTNHNRIAVISLWELQWQCTALYLYNNPTFHHPIRTSHGGQYSCQATLGVVNNTAAVIITVLSKSVLSFLCSNDCGLTLFLHVVPPLSVTITIDQSSSIISAGANFTLTCITELPPEVDTNITMNINWTGPAGDPLPGSSNSLPMAGIPTRYQNILMVNPVNASQFGNYSCTATVNSDSASIFITASEGSATVTIIGNDTLLSCVAVSIWRSLYSGKFTQAQILQVIG